MVRLDKVHTHIHTLEVASSSAALDRGTGSAEAVPPHPLFVFHLLLLSEQLRFLLESGFWIVGMQFFCPRAKKRQMDLGELRRFSGTAR